MYQVENILKSLNKSKFRSSFSLKQKDLEYIEKKGLSEIRKHAYDILEKRLVPADILNDGKQPRQQVAVACCAIKTGCPLIGVCFPSFGISAGTNLFSKKS